MERYRPPKKYPYSMRSPKNKVLTRAQQNPVARGRPRGCLGHRTRTVHEAVLAAANSIGEDGIGTGQLVGFLRREALKKDNKAFMALLARIIPMQVSGVGGGPLRIITARMDPQEAAQAYAQTLGGLLGLAGPELDGPPLVTLDEDEYKDAAE